MSDLKAQRKLAGWTQFQLARRSGVSRMKLSLVECDQAELSADEKVAVQQALFAAIEARAMEFRGVLSNKEVVTA